MKKILLMALFCLTFIATTTVAEENEMTNKKVLVAYFSATGTTAKVAQRLATATGGDIFEIKPQYPYTDADLNWMDKNSRSSIEMADRRTRPEIASKVADMSQYNVIFVGFPIWWYREPSIIDTFIESYDFADKTLIPFATSGGSDIGDSGKNIQELAPKAEVFPGKRFSNNVSEEDLKTWAKEWL